jgi:MoxR-like ATPase
MSAQGAKLIQKIKDEISKGIIGQHDFVDGLITALLTGGHVLIEGLPGLAKTRAVHLLSKIAGLDFKRLQFTPDLLPADIIGTRIYNQSTAGFETKKGPVFANFILADEINRAPAKVQSALLEAMQEHQVTIGENTFPLPEPFFVFATMNPVEQEGTYKLPEAQLDRFLLKLIVDYPQKDEENEIVSMVIHETSLPDVSQVFQNETLKAMQKIVREIHIEDKLIEYITTIVFASRDPKKYGLNLTEAVSYGGSPRASISLAKASQAAAYIDNRTYVTTDDIKRSAYSVLRHRIIPSYLAEADGITSDTIIDQILETVQVP